MDDRIASATYLGMLAVKLLSLGLGLYVLGAALLLGSRGLGHDDSIVAAIGVLIRT